MYSSERQKKYTVLIADDEYLVRERLKKNIDWDGLGLELIGEAEDGEEALHIIEQSVPDIAVIDINMPILNGLKLIQIINTNYSGTKTVILSGYNEFHYAQEAIRNNVVEYLLKPMKKTDLERVLKKVISMLDKEKHAEHQRNKARKVNEELVQQNDVHQLNRLLLGCTMTKEVSRYVKKLLDRNDGLFLHMVCVTQAARRTKGEASTADGLRVIRGKGDESHVPDEKKVDDQYIKTFYNALFYYIENRIMQRTYFIYHFPAVFGGELLMVKTKSPELPHLEDFLKKWEKIQSADSDISKFMSIAVSNQFDKEVSLSCRYHQIRKALLDRFFYPEKIIFPVKQKDGEVQDIQYMVNQWNPVFERKALDPVETLISEHFNRLKEISHGVLLEKYLQAVLLKIDDMVKQNQMIAADETWEGVDALRLLERFDNLDDVEKWLTTMIRHIIEEYLAEDEKDHSLSERVKQYIDASFGDPSLDLQTIAFQVYAHPNYISTCFKRDMEMGISSYVKKVRLAHAKEMLENSCIQVKDAAWMVGFTDQYYFSKCFKKEFGISPKSACSK
ncbi:MAG: response regulator [Spirochaetia bacterium]|nr:response regulator [Spirochaetia bacterium]